MYSDYKTLGGLFSSGFFRGGLTAFLCLLIMNIAAQNTSSPYSILGIGETDTKDFGRYFAGGNASLARRDPNSYNFSNPASLTALPLKMMNFDVAFMGRLSNFRTAKVDSVTSNSKDMVLKRISMAFRVSEKAAFAFGLRPYSSVNYQYNTQQEIGGGSGSYTKYIEGQGGINQVYFSYAKALGKGWNAGFTGSWLFGSLIKQTQYYSELADLDVGKRETDFYYGSSIQAGLQYHSREDNKLVHYFGLTGTANSTLKGQRTTAFTDVTGTLTTETESGRKFKMPLSAGAGYSLSIKNLISISADANFYNWPYQKLNYANSYTGNAFRFSAGVEYSPKINMGNYAIEKGYLAAGVSYEKNYMTIQGSALTDMSVSLGGGYNLARNIFIHGGIELGRKGNISRNQVQENYTRFVMGFTLKNIWMGAKKYGRFD
jgi:hypothetical protein